VRPDGGPHSHEEGQQRQSVRFVEIVQVAVEGEVGMRVQPSVPQVHQQERQVVEDVRRREVVAEFQAVEQGRLAFDQADVA
jgi:hypothetical protein